MLVGCYNSMLNTAIDVNNKLYDDMIDYKYHKTSTWSNCKNRNTNLFQMSLAIGYSFLLDDYKRSTESDGWIFYSIADTNDLIVSSKRVA